MHNFSSQLGESESIVVVSKSDIV